MDVKQRQGVQGYRMTACSNPERFLWVCGSTYFV